VINVYIILQLLPKNVAERQHDVPNRESSLGSSQQKKVGFVCIREIPKQKSLSDKFSLDSGYNG